MSLNNEKLTSHVLKNSSIINVDSVTIISTKFIDSDSTDYYFLNKKAIKYDSSKSDNKEVANSNINLITVDQSINRATVIYEYYPNWKNCDTSPYPSYSNALFFIVESSFELIDNQWVLTNTKIQDVQFLSWMKMISWKCVHEKYLPL